MDKGKKHVNINLDMRVLNVTGTERSNSSTLEKDINLFKGKNIKCLFPVPLWKNDVIFVFNCTGFSFKKFLLRVRVSVP